MTVESSIEAAVFAEKEAAWTEMGAGVDQSAMADATVEAALAYDAALDAGSNTAEADVRSDLAEVESSMGLDTRAQSEVDSQSHMALRSTLHAQGSAVTDAMTIASARAEAHRTTTGTRAAVENAGASGTTIGIVSSANATLMTELESAGSVAACQQAYDSYETTLLTSGSAVIDEVTGLSIGNDLLVDAAATAAVTLEQTVEGNVTAPSSSADAEATADVILGAWATYETAIEDAIAAAQASEIDSSASLLVHVTSAFSAS